MPEASWPDVFWIARSALDRKSGRFYARLAAFSGGAYAPISGLVGDRSAVANEGIPTSGKFFSTAGAARQNASRSSY